MDKPQIILIPGLLNDANLWRDQIKPLSAVAEPVVADITQADSLQGMVEAVLALAQPQFALAGFSLGGIVAQEVIKAAPDRVTHLALINTTMLPDSPDRAADRDKLVALARNPGRFHGFGEKLLETYLAPENRHNAAFADRIRGMTERLGAEVFIRQSLIPRPDNRVLLRQINCPTLVLCGESDALTPPSVHRDMAIAIPGAQLSILPTSGHMTPIEQPRAVSDALMTLLRR